MQRIIAWHESTTEETYFAIANQAHHSTTFLIVWSVGRVNG